MTLSDLVNEAVAWRLPLLSILSAAVIVMLVAGDVLRPGAVKRHGVRDVKPLAWPVWLFGGLVVFLSFALLPATIAQMGWLIGPDPNSARAQATIAGITYLCAGLFALGMVHLAKRSAPNAGFTMGLVDLMNGVGCFVLAVPIVLLTAVGAEWLHTELTGKAPSALGHPTLVAIVDNQSNVWGWILIAVVVIGAPLVEEVIYRGFMQSAILRATGSVVASIGITSVVFVASHIGWTGDELSIPWHALATIFVLGLCMGIAMERTKRLGVPIAMHACFNAMNVAIALAA